MRLTGRIIYSSVSRRVLAIADELSPTVLERSVREEPKISALASLGIDEDEQGLAKL
jgi:hypothetical protein